MLTVWTRWASALGVATGVLWIVAFVASGSTPDTTGTQAQVRAYYSSNSNQHRQILALFIFLLGVFCVVGFLVALRDRLASALGDGGFPTVTLAAGLMSAVFWLLAVCGFVAPAFMAEDTGPGSVTLQTYRLFSDTAFPFWVMAAMLGALVIWSTSAVALRTGVLPRWFAWLGILIGVLLFASFLFIPALLYWVWLIAASALLQWRTSPAVAAQPAPITA